MKVSILLIILGFSQVLGGNFETLKNGGRDNFNAKSDEIQSGNEKYLIELGDMVSNKLEDSEAESSELSQPKRECAEWETTCSSNEDRKQCSDCPNRAYCAYSYDYEDYNCFCKKECAQWEKTCSINEDCKQCSDCPNGAYCAFETKLGYPDSYDYDDYYCFCNDEDNDSIESCL